MIQILLLLFFCSVGANEPFQPLPNGSFHIANLNGDPSAIVGGCVNVITGDFFDTQRDLFMVGGQPLVLERSYCSSDFSMGGLSNGWHLNTQGVVTNHTVKGPYGGEIPYQDCGVISPEMLHNGLTNNSSGCLSGKTNLKNSTLHYHTPTQENCILLNSDFTHSFFTKVDNDLFKLTSDIKPNGMSLHYNYCIRGLESVMVLNTMRERKQSITFAYPDNNSWKPPSHLTVYANDGRIVQYGFKSFKYKNHHYKAFRSERAGIEGHASEPREAHESRMEREEEEARREEEERKHAEEGDYPRFYLSSVQRPNAPNERYVYEKKNTEDHHFERVIQKWLPDNRFLGISYYVKAEGEQNVGRVKSLEGFIGEGMISLPMYRFFYNQEACRVYNALDAITDYYWDNDKRLKKVVKNGSLIDELYWGEGADYGNLRSHVCSTPTETLFCKCYRYDARGNVLNEWLYGNLTGHNNAPLYVGAHGIPIETGCERIEKQYVYSNDARNLLLVEQEANRSKRYRYLPNSNLLEAAFTFDHDKVVLRNSYRYDENCTLVEETLDDGYSANLNDISGATFRKIRRIQTRKIQPFDVPEVVEEYSVDLSSGQEHLYKMLVNSYSIEGHLTQQEHYDSNREYAYTLEWKYNAYGNVIYEKDALGCEIFREFDANGNLVSEINPAGYSKKYYYDFANRLLRMDEIHPDRVMAQQYRYDWLGRKIASIDCYGNETKYSYDEFDRITEIVSPPVMNEKGDFVHSTVKKVYDALGNVVHSTDALGNTTYTSYNLRGKPKLILYPDGSVEHFSYFLHGPLAGKIERNGCSLHYTYDYLDRLIETKCCDPQMTLLWSTSATYDTQHMLSETDCAGHITEYTYDIHGRKSSKKTGNRLEEYEYDSLHRLTKVITHLDNGDCIAKVTLHNKGGQVIEERTEDAHGKIIECSKFVYDAVGRRIHVIVGESIIVTHYDSYGTPYEVIDPLGNSTKTVQSFKYLNNQYVAYQEVTDARGNTTVITKDALGREAEVIRKNALGEIKQKREIFYDLNGNKAKVVETVFSDQSYQVTHLWQYDSMNRAVRCTEAFGTPEQKITEYQFNQIGQLERIIKPSGVAILHRYNAEGFLQEFFSSDTSIHYTFSYDCHHNVIASYDEVHKKNTIRSYDAYNQVVEEQLGNDLTLQFAYDTVGRVTKLTLPDISSLSYRYESSFLKLITRYSPSGEALYSHSYDVFDHSLNPIKQTLIGKAGLLTLSFDKKNRAQSIVSKATSETNSYDALDNLIKREGKDALGTNNASYAYDDLNQLIEEKGVEEHSYRFDSLHNRIAKDGLPSSYNHLNQLVDSGYQYDQDGRLIKTPFAEYTYDALDRLISMTKGKVTATYTYDSFHRRLTKTIGNVTWKYLYADQNDIGCYKDGKLIEFRALGLGHGAEIGASVAIELNGTPYAPIHDLNGNITTLLSQKGAVADTYRYTAFGEEITKPKLNNPWRFSSKRYDDESSLTYFGRRYYAPTLARWLTPDPLSYQAGPNLYAYVSNNPLTVIDLYGLFGQERECRMMPSAIYTREVINKASEYISDCSSRLRESLSDTGDRIAACADSACRQVKDFSDTFLIKSQPMPSGTGCTDGKPPTEYGISLANGQANILETCFQSAVFVSRECGGVEVDYLINETHGAIPDSFHSWKMIYFEKIKNEKIYHTKSMIEKNLLKKDLHGNIHFAHSQGAAITNRALPLIDAQLLKKLIVYTFGGAKMISHVGLKKCVNYVSIFDPVPFLADPFGFAIASVCRDRYTIEYLKPEIPFMDHSFTSGPYGKQIARIGRDYKLGRY